MSVVSTAIGTISAGHASTDTGLKLAALGRKYLPGPVVHRINRLRGRQVQPPLDLSRLAFLQRVDQRWLRDPARLPSLIRQMGLSDAYPHLMPPAAYPWLGSGLRTLQYPHQFADYLTFLATMPVSSYVEVGVASGGSFALTLGYLEATGHRVTRAVAIDPVHAPGLTQLKKKYSYFEFLRTLSTDSAVTKLLQGQGWDLVFIDGDHSYAACRTDFELAQRWGARMIAFHDIVDAGCPGVQRVWRDIRRDYADTYDFREFVQQYPEVTSWTRSTHFGIGVAVSKDAAASAPAAKD